jgi:hypothetical protein
MHMWNDQNHAIARLASVRETAAGAIIPRTEWMLDEARAKATAT